MSQTTIKITHRATGSLLAEGPIGWGITPFEGNYYIHRRYLKDGSFQVNYIPGLCPYKFLYVWMDWLLPNGERQKSLGWMYWLPNPLFPFIWFRVAVPGNHPSLCYERHGPVS
ncbi:MAG TPA: hypothetical protein VND66_02140 [Acidobacteriaceae bacterium]|nr:hypothetical protein [Acidobacteriaceae bacterium]